MQKPTVTFSEIMAPKLTREQKNREKLFNFLRDRKVNDLTSEAQRLGIQVTVLASMDPAMSSQRDTVIGGNMPPDVTGGGDEPGQAVRHQSLEVTCYGRSI